MNGNVDIELIIDEKRTIPEVKVYASKKNEQVERIINAIRDASDSEHSAVYAYSDGKLELVPQRDIMRIRTEGRQVVLDTAERYYIIKQTLT
ncbi:MAG: hypothetical protein IJT65_02555, partial [Eubacterium sp.]|nr:hypothetical protein [Eubacterium sp.]